LRPEPLSHPTTVRRCAPPPRSGRPATGRRRSHAARSWLSLTFFFCIAARAADLPYTIAIAPTGDVPLDQAIADASRLVRLQDQSPVGPFALIARAESDAARMDQVLRSFAHYDAVTVVRIAGRASSDAGLLAFLERLPEDSAVRVDVAIDPGPVYRIGSVRLDGPVPNDVRRAFHLSAGQPARAADVLAAGEAVLSALREDGFALARVGPPDALVDHGKRTMDVVYVAEPGSRFDLGDVSVAGLDRLDEDYVRRRLGIEAGEPFSPSRLERARQDLLAHGVLAWARLTPGDAPDEAGRLPLLVEVAERPPRVVRLGGAYATDEGATLSAAWMHRNLFGGAEELTLQGEVGRLTQNRRADLSYLLRAALRLPDLWLRDQDLRLDLAGISEQLEAYDRDAVTAGAFLERRFAPGLTGRAGLSFEDARVAQGDAPEDYQMLSLPLTVTYDSTDDPLDPTRGVRLLAEAAPVRVLQGPAEGFVRGRAVASGYWKPPIAAWRGPSDHPLPPAGDAPVGDGEGLAPTQTVLAARLALGTVQGAAVDEVPPDWRFYAGGGGSVRGFPFQSIGPRTASGRPAGGDGLLEASLELRLRLGAQWGAVAFVDAGAVSEQGMPRLGDLSVGAGIGVRYHTPIGPVRVDVATPLTASSGDSPVQLYIAIGQAF
jgi:translocation and assembly module TamA